MLQVYDVCDRFKNEKIPPKEVETRLRTYSQDITKFHSSHIKDSPLSSGWWRDRDINEMCCHYWLLHIKSE